MNMPVRIHCLPLTPVKLSGKETVAIASIIALETIVMTAMHKNYSVELSGETTEDGRLKGTLKLKNSQDRIN